MGSSAVAAVFLLSTGCNAFVLGPVLRPGCVSRSGTAQLGLFDFLKRPGPVELVGTVANPADFSDEELTALKIARWSRRLTITRSSTHHLTRHALDPPHSARAVAAKRRRAVWKSIGQFLTRLGLC